MLADLCQSPEGVISGFGFAPASTKDQLLLAETFFSLRSVKPIHKAGERGVGGSSGVLRSRHKGFKGEENH